MPAPEGNNNGAVAKTLKDKRELAKKFAQHLRDGYSEDSFPPCDYRTIRGYLEDIELQPEKEMVEQASREGILLYERMGKKGTNGEIKGFNSKSWEFIMMNKTGWKRKNDTDHTTKGEKLPTPVNITNLSGTDLDTALLDTLSKGSRGE